KAIPGEERENKAIRSKEIAVNARQDKTTSRKAPPERVMQHISGKKKQSSARQFQARQFQ
ncbi:hypothetical protein P7K49_026316, partial [Saguinus oedipus]